MKLKLISTVTLIRGDDDHGGGKFFVLIYYGGTIRPCLYYTMKNQRKY